MDTILAYILLILNWWCFSSPFPPLKNTNKQQPNQQNSFNEIRKDRFKNIHLPTAWLNLACCLFCGGGCCMLSGRWGGPCGCCGLPCCCCCGSLPWGGCCGLPWGGACCKGIGRRFSGGLYLEGGGSLRRPSSAWRRAKFFRRVASLGPGNIELIKTHRHKYSYC